MLEIEYGRLKASQNYSNIANFKSYQRISVSIEINAKYR